MSTRVDRMIQRVHAPLSALRPVVPSVFSPEPSLRDDIQESSPGSAESPHTQGVSGSVGEDTTLTFSKPAPTDISDSRVSEALPTAQESPRLKLSSFPDREASISRDEPKLLDDRLLATPPSEPTQSRTSKASSFSDLPPASGAASSSPSATTLKNEADATRRAQESATASARTRQADQPPLTVSNFAESLIEVNVSIGSIDFRSARPAEPVKRSEARPHVTLDSYLQRGKRDAR
jgi:hypothetical protein